MALTQVRAKLGDTWITITYNEATGRYEGTLTPSGTSINEPGGYFPVTVEAVNEGGETATASGETMASLRLTVRETVSPVLTLISPAPGYLTTASPSFVFSAVDETGGSGIDVDTAQAAIDGAQTPCTVTEAERGYTLTVAASGLSEGPHLVTVSVSDRDGNPATASAAYTVDTAPPVLRLTRPNSHRIVDAAAIDVAGTAADATSGVAAVTVGGVEVTVIDGGFHRLVPLEVGINEITVTGTDAAGLTASESFQVLRLVTDRGDADRERILELCRRGYSHWTEEERAWWAKTGSRWGSYNNWDFNRVNLAMTWLNTWLRAYGYLPACNPDTRELTDADILDIPDETRLVRNTEGLREVLPLDGDVPETPETVRSTIQANHVEAILVAVDAVRPLIDVSPWTCGEISCGEF